VAEFKKRNNKAKRTICDAVRDDGIPHLTGKDYAFEMWASLCKLYQSPNQNQKMVLQEKLRSIQMLKSESVTSNLGRFTQARDELATVGEIVDPDFLVRTTLNGFSKPWGSFVRGIVVREVMPSWERLWDDFVQEELRCGSSGQQRISEGDDFSKPWGSFVRGIVVKEIMPNWERLWENFVQEELRCGSSGQQRIYEGDEDLSLWSKGKKKVGKGARQGPKMGAKPPESGSGKKRDMSKVKCFACNNMGHYVGQCPNGKKRSCGTTATTDEEEFATQFERECVFLICCTSVETTPNIWYIDSGASSHMTGVREHFIDLKDPKVNMDIALRDDTIIRVVGSGTMTFQRDTMPPISFRDVLYVPGLKKNLISISTLQDRGLEVSFRGTEVLIHPKGSRLTSG
jgi:hypothetical protein